MQSPKPTQKTSLDAAVHSIQVRFGSQALVRAAALPPPEPWPAGDPFDRLSGIGGLPRGRLSVLVGTGTCGKHSLGLRLLAQASVEFAHAVVVDSPRQFDAWALMPFEPNLKAVTV